MIHRREATVLIIYLSLSVVSADFLTAGVFAAVSAWLNNKGYTSSEYCTDRWISTNYTDLKLTLEAKLYGQHLVIEPLVKYLKAHGKDNPRKTLVLSFHGGTGTGKNYASKIVAEKMFVKGMKSKYVHLISAVKEFPHQYKTDSYKDKLKDFIETRVKECPRSLFIIDEMDKMPPGIIDTLKPYLDFYDSLDGVDYRKATFFFLSNTAAKDIAEKAITTWKNGLERESIKLKEMEEIIRLPALNEKSGLWHSELIVNDLITAYLPFLPLERGHIKQCIRDGLIRGGYYKLEKEISEIKVQEIADELRYYPEGLGVFSTTGCKRVYQKIGFIMEEEL
ncbi:torsin-1A-like isoform X2 [Mercenaria mercenaria]|uniref:torsin-1A-like isoform X2 n=1 Tax=Mercenaria mercenaria TaxID=6596 RepID=UPI00234F8FB6|nr:torsin-1A-like isoform X2 [Mercenaria mercenaria]